MILFEEAGFGGAILVSWYMLANSASAAIEGSKDALCSEAGDVPPFCASVGLVDSSLVSSVVRERVVDKGWKLSIEEESRGMVGLFEAGLGGGNGLWLELARMLLAALAGLPCVIVLEGLGDRIKPS